mmetsp:Transcript_82410/g.191417  ORF Transcript_82410/g.191417 Transcript_82410/m.191417 type:complete len:406 (-) Transcript_82410:445-1662(-)
MEGVATDDPHESRRKGCARVQKGSSCVEAGNLLWASHGAIAVGVLECVEPTIVVADVNNAVAVDGWSIVRCRQARAPGWVKHTPEEETLAVAGSRDVRPVRELVLPLLRTSTGIIRVDLCLKLRTDGDLWNPAVHVPQNIQQRTWQLDHEARKSLYRHMLQTTVCGKSESRQRTLSLRAHVVSQHLLPWKIRVGADRGDDREICPASQLPDHRPSEEGPQEVLFPEQRAILEPVSVDAASALGVMADGLRLGADSVDHAVWPEHQPSVAPTHHPRNVIPPVLPDQLARVKVEAVDLGVVILEDHGAIHGEDGHQIPTGHIWAERPQKFTARGVHCDHASAAGLCLVHDDPIVVFDVACVPAVPVCVFPLPKLPSRVYFKGECMTAHVVRQQHPIHEGRAISKEAR